MSTGMLLVFSVSFCIVSTSKAFGRNRLRGDAVVLDSTVTETADLAACAVQRDSRREPDQLEDQTPCLGLSETSLRGKVNTVADVSGDLQQIEFFRSDVQGASRRRGNVLGEQTVVWISGYARSGTSTALSMVAAAGAERFDQQDPAALQDSEAWTLAASREDASTLEQDGTVFAMFEPCHFARYFWQGGDKVKGSVAKEGCKGLVKALADCDFSEVQSLHLWANRHSVHVGVKEYSEQAASKACSAADVVAYKTIWYGHNLQDKAIPLVDTDPRMRVISVVRDPRGIFASWRTTWPFSYRIGRHLMIDICDNFAKNINVSHPQVQILVFEELAKEPVKVTKRMYKFLGLQFGERQHNWISKNFDADCGDEGHFTDCKSNSSSHIEGWRTIMMPEEKRFFTEYQPCRVVAARYGYPME